MAVRSRRVFGPTPLNTAFTLLYTVPAGRTLVLRGLTAVNVGAVAIPVRIVVNSLAWPAGAVWAVSIPGGESREMPEGLVLNPFDWIGGETMAAPFAMVVTGSGSLLDGAPT